MVAALVPVRVVLEEMPVRSALGELRRQRRRAEPNRRLRWQAERSRGYREQQDDRQGCRRDRTPPDVIQPGEHASPYDLSGTATSPAACSGEPDDTRYATAMTLVHKCRSGAQD